MKKSWSLTALGCLLILAGCLLVIRCPRTVPLGQCSGIYRHYADMPGIDATFIEDYKVNDTITVDVTLLEARDSAGWAILKHDFDVPNLEPKVQQIIDNGKDLIFSRQIAKKDSSDTTQHDVLATSYYSHALTIYHTNSNDELYAISEYNYDKSINQN